MNTITFSDLNLSQPILRALAEEKYTSPTPIQEKSIPHVLTGGDIFGCAQTGTGKTAAFSLPILELLSKNSRPRKAWSTRALVLTPTRELALQVRENIAIYGRHVSLKSAVVFGGVSLKGQIRNLQNGVDILVATPGRLLDLFNQRYLNLSEVEIFVLDEADRMLDMGFMPDVQRILKQLPKERQNLLFAATMPPNILRLASSILKNPLKIEVAPASTPAEKIDQSVLFVERENKCALLHTVLKDEAVKRVLVFTRTKRGANRVAKRLYDSGIRADAIHSDKSQNARQKALYDFSRGKIRVLVATDIAARGIDVDGISHVINYELPNDPESYVHRIGRTARANTEGIAISFCDREEHNSLRSIERLIRQNVRVVVDHPYHSTSRDISRGGGRRRSAHRY